MKERKIGEIIHGVEYLSDDGLDIVSVIVEKDKEQSNNEMSCDNCLFFMCELEYQSSETQEKLGPCSKKKRADKQNVIFKVWEGK